MIQLIGIFFGACGGPMVGIFLLGGLFRFTNYIVNRYKALPIRPLALFYRFRGPYAE
jgi:hypothetical protein